MLLLDNLRKVINVNAIKKRKSVRSFNGNNLTVEQRESIMSYISDEKNRTGINGNIIDIKLYEVLGRDDMNIGTHGLITDAPAFLITSCENSSEVMLDLGYVFEKLIIYLENIGLNTCWLGGVFNSEEIKTKANIGKDVFIPIISPVGTKSENRSQKENAIRKYVNSDTRADFDKIFFKDDFNHKINNPIIKKILEMVRLAPSASNNQPWRVVIEDDNQAHFFIERTIDYGKTGLVTVDYDIQMIDIGIALAHFELASNNNEFYKASNNMGRVNDTTTYVISAKL